MTLRNLADKPSLNFIEDSGDFKAFCDDCSLSFIFVVPSAKKKSKMKRNMLLSSRRNNKKNGDRGGFQL